MAETQARPKWMARPPLWVMSILVAAAVLFYMVVNRPETKPTVSVSQPAATTPAKSNARAAAVHRTASAKQPAPPVTVAPLITPVTSPLNTAPPTSVPPVADTAPPTTVAPVALAAPANPLLTQLPRTD